MHAPPRADSRATELLARAEEQRARIVAELGRNPERVIRLVLVRSQDDFNAMQPGGTYAPFWAAGLTYPALGLIYLKQSGSSGQFVEVEKTLDHELSHALLYDAIGGRRIPRWFEEGVAQWQAREVDLERIVRVSGAVWTGRLIALKDLDTNYPRHETDVHLAYDESYEFISFLIGEFGSAGFRKLIHRLNDGDTLEQALRLAYGLSGEELEARWHAGLRLSYAWLPLITSGTLVWLLASILFLMSYARRRRERRARYERWEEEERTVRFDPFNLAPKSEELPEFVEPEEVEPEEKNDPPILH